MNRTYAVGALAVLTTGFTALAATPASATTVIGFGNAAHDNACTNTGGARASGATARHSGTVGGLAVALPYSTPGNQCGNLGLPSEDTASLLVGTYSLVDPYN